MSKMKKAIVLTLTAAFLFTSLMGCGGSKDTAKKDTVTPAPTQAAAADNTAAKTDKKDKVVEITFWDMVWGPKESIEMGTKLVEQFNSLNKGIKVKYQSTPWNNWYQTFATAIASGSAPDISTGAGYQPFQFAKTGAILPIDDVIEDMKKSGDINDFMGNVVEPLKYKDHYIAYPWSFDIRVFYYRKDLFDVAGLQAPKNWNEFRDAAKKLTKGGNFGYVIPGDGMGGHTILTFLLNNGGGLFTADGKPNMMNERNVEAIQFLSDMVKKDKSINPAGAGYKGDDVNKAFTSGAAAIMLGTPGLEARFPELKGKMAMMEPLQGPHGDKGTLYWDVSLMLYQQTKYPAETKEFLKWWSKNMKEYWTKGNIGVMPVRKSIAADAFFAGNPSNKIVFENYMPIAKTTGAMSSSLFPELNEVEGDGFLNTMAQAIMLGEDTKLIMKKGEESLKKIMESSK